MSIGVDRLIKALEPFRGMQLTHIHTEGMGPVIKITKVSDIEVNQDYVIDDGNDVILGGTIEIVIS